MTFRERVYEIAKQIPAGKVATYGQIARMAGKPKAARAVGVFMKTIPFAPIVPCHRVVAGNGKLQGYSAGKGIETKRDMLVAEGVSFNGDRVNLSESRWSKFDLMDTDISKYDARK